MRSIAAAKFKQQCLALLDSVGPEGIVITKHGRPVARLVPFQRATADLIGSLKDRIRITKDIMTTGVVWHAES
jgi:prevent-host-death family protein